MCRRFDPGPDHLPCLARLRLASPDFPDRKAFFVAEHKSLDSPSREAPRRQILFRGREGVNRFRIAHRIVLSYHTRLDPASPGPASPDFPERQAFHVACRSSIPYNGSANLIFLTASV